MTKCHVLLLSCIVLATGTLAFSPRDAKTMRLPASAISTRPRPNFGLFSTPDPEETSSEAMAEAPVSSPPPVPQTSSPDSASYPIDVPSPILLSLSMVLAIIGTGSSFDLFGGSPSLGFVPTAAVAAVTIPLALYFFYASILKATAETEADDREFMKGKY